MNTNFKSTSKSCLQSYILPSLTGRGSLLESVALHWGRVCFFLLSLLLFAACSSDNDEQVQQPQPEKSYPLTIEVTENPMTGDGENSSNRAAITDISTLETFYLNYQYNSVYSGSGDKQSITNTSGTWSGGNWPSDVREGNPDVNVTWYAYTDGTFNWSDEGPKEAYINFAVEESATLQKDLLVAKVTGKTWNNCSGHLSFTFDHACAALRFLVKKAKNLNDYTLNISPSAGISIKLFNVVNQGKYYFDKTPPSWGLTDNRSGYTLYTGTFEDLRSDAYTELSQGTGPYLFMIPQKLDPWNHTGEPTNTYIELNCSISKGGDPGFSYSGKAYIPFDYTLEKGNKYDVKINIGKNSLYKVVGGTASLIIP